LFGHLTLLLLDDLVQFIGFFAEAFGLFGRWPDWQATVRFGLGKLGVVFNLLLGRLGAGVVGSGVRFDLSELFRLFPSL
jgi:hypothetical protein